MLETLLSAIALSISIITFFITYQRSRLVDRISSYLAIERDGDSQIFSLLIQNDSLNELFFEKPKSEPPNPGTALENLTSEQRALLNFGTVILDYFEQMILLDQFHLIPQEIPLSWEPWLDECLRAPYFRWVWEESRDHYHPRLQRSIEKKLEKVTQSTTVQIPAANL